MFDIGRLCIKTAGREAGKYCVILSKIDDNFVLVTGPRSLTQVKRRKCNILHLEPLKQTLGIKADASDEEVIKAYEEASLFTKLDLQKPAAGEKASGDAFRHESRHHEQVSGKEEKAAKHKKAKKKEAE
jgi:large subunit ribosomal protein L14e